MSDCLFCKIAAGEIPAAKLYDDGEVLAFRDINPEAPSARVAGSSAAYRHAQRSGGGDASLVGRLYLAGKQVAVDLGVAESGYRTVINCNRDAGQIVFHIHMHSVGGPRTGLATGLREGSERPLVSFCRRLTTA
ncbi:MAG: HIT domain-containing protein [Candidatus Competibacteraceae bacterium]|nr:HIT domain-containing protein [Candidatus Competibacteraceae bacterium]